MNQASHLTVLVTDGEHRASLAVVRSLGGAGHTVYVTSPTGRSLAGASKFARSEISTPDPLSDEAGFAESLAQIAQDVGADIIIPMTEPSLLAVLPRRAMYGDSCIPFASADVFSRIADKQAVLDVAAKLGIATPAQHVIAAPEDASSLVLDALDYPVVVKPARSVAGGESHRIKLGVEHAADAATLGRILQATDWRAYPLLIQQRIVGPGIGVFLLLWDGRTVATFAHRRIREKPPSGGVSVYRESVTADHDLVERSRALLDAFRWKGVAMIEYKIDSATGRPYLMEINGRFWGSLQLAIDAGVDFPRLLVEVARGGRTTHQSSYRVGVKSRWFWGDVDHLAAMLRHSPRQLALPPGSPGRGAAIRAFFSRHAGDREEVMRLADPKPFLRESAQWFRDLRHRG